MSSKDNLFIEVIVNHFRRSVRNSLSKPKQAVPNGTLLMLIFNDKQIVPIGTSKCVTSVNNFKRMQIKAISFL
jgi:hypothetical protein